MGQSVFQTKILADGRIKLTTEGAVAEEHHLQADEMLKFIQEKCGGIRETEHLKDPVTQQHHHDHEHHEHKH